MVPAEPVKPMKAVILAAGQAKRFGKFKPLVPLFGLPLIEHTILGLRRMGIKEIGIVYNRKELKEYLSKKYPNLVFIHNPHPERENGYSLLLAREFATEPFILAMADHYFSTTFFERRKLRDNTIFVSSQCVDPKEATKVKVRDGYVENIGKEIDDYDYFDTGMFFCTPDIFNLASQIQKDVLRLSDIMKSLAAQRKLKYVMVKDFWIDVDTPESLKFAEQKIEESIMKGEDGYIARAINRKISMRITRAIAKYSWSTPNALTTVSLCMGLFSALLFFLHLPLLGGIFTQLTSIIDGCDGEMARLKRMSSKFGASFDALSDRYVDILIVLGLLYNISINWISAFLFFFAVTGVILFSYTWHLTGIRVRWGGRDVRLFLVFLFTLPLPLLRYSIPALLLILGVITHTSAVASLVKMRGKI